MELPTAELWGITIKIKAMERCGNRRRDVNP